MQCNVQERLAGEVVSLTEPVEDGVVGPGPGLRKYSNTRNLRVVGEYHSLSRLQIETCPLPILYLLKGHHRPLIFAPQLFLWRKVNYICLSGVQFLVSSPPLKDLPRFLPSELPHKSCDILRNFHNFRFTLF